MSAPVKLAYCASHPIQYQAPLLRRIAREPGIDLTVFFGSDFSARGGYRDRGFGREVDWDVPLLEGFKYRVLPRLPGTKNIYSGKPPSFGYLRAFRRERFDVVWVHGYAQVNSLHALLAARATGATTLLRSDSTLTDRPRGRAKSTARHAFFAALRPLVDCVLTTGTRNAEYWSATFGEQTPQVLMPYAVDNAWFRARTEEAAPHREALRKSLGLERGRPIILFAAKLISRKRCMDLLEAYARLSPDGRAEPHPYLLIAGDGEERATLEARARSLGWPSIRFLGFRSQRELPPLFDLCDVFCLPSVQEPWGLVINEVMASGRAVIVSDETGCAPDLVRDGVNGYVFPSGHIEKLAHTLRKCFSPATDLSGMGHAAQKTMQAWSFEQDIAALHRAILKAG